MKNASISTRIIVGLVIVIVVVLGISGAINIFSARNALNKDLNQKVVQLSERLAVQMVSYVWDLNNSGAETVLAFEFKDKNLAGIEIITSDSSKFVSILRDEKWEAKNLDLTDEFKKKNHLSHTSDIIRDNNSIGTVNVYFTNEFVNKEILKEIGANLLQIIILIILIVIALIYLVKLIVTTPLKELLIRFDTVSKGDADLTCRIEVHRKDEIGSLANSFNQFVCNLNDIIVRVVNTNKSVLDEVYALANLSEKLVKNAENVKLQSSSISAAVEEISANGNSIAFSTQDASQTVSNSTLTSKEIATDMKDVAQAVQKITYNIKDMNNFIQSVFSNVEKINVNIDEVVTGVNNSAAAIEQMSASLSEISVNMQKANNISKEADVQSVDTMKIMQELQKSAHEIGKIVDVINTIADQTNMLALNATIEAASAGEAGKGFAVVANEVKALAKQTGEATEKIAQQIDNVQLKTKNAVDSMTIISNTVKELYEISNGIALSVEQQSFATNEISTSVSRAANSSRSVSQFAADIRNSVQQLSGNAENVLSTTQMISSKTDQAANATDNLAQTTNNISNLVSDIARNTQEITLGLNEISTNVNNMTQLSDGNSLIAEELEVSTVNLKNDIEEMNKVVSRFKL